MESMRRYPADHVAILLEASAPAFGPEGWAVGEARGDECQVALLAVAFVLAQRLGVELAAVQREVLSERPLAEKLQGEGG